METTSKKSGFTLGQNLNKDIAQYEALYAGSTPEQKKALDNIANDYGYQEAVDAGGFGNSQFVTNLLVKTTQQIVKSTSFSYIETSLQRIEMITNGATWVNYTDIFQGSSSLNSDIYTTDETGESVKAINPNDDVTIDDFNAKTTPIYEEEYKTDFNYSRKVSIRSNLLNDFALTQATYMALIKDISRYVGAARDILNYQRTLTFLGKTENYNKVFTYTEDSFNPNTQDADTLKDNNKKMFTELRAWLIGLNSPSRNHLKASGTGASDTIPLGATQPLIFDGKGKEIVVLMDVAFEAQMNTFMRSGTYNLGEIAFPENITFKFVNMQTWIEWLPTITNGTTGFGKIFGGNQLPLFVGMSKGAYVEISFYKASTLVATPKLSSVLTEYEQKGQYRDKTEIMFAGGYEILADQPTYNTEIGSLVANVKNATVTVAGGQPIAPQVLAYLKAYSGAKTVADVANAKVISTSPTDAAQETTATPATGIISVPVVSGKKATANTNIGVTFNYKNSTK